MDARARFTARHAALAGIAYLLSAGLVLAAFRSPLRAAEVALGPFAGGVAREWQSCCAANSLALAPYASALLAAGVAAQFLLVPVSPWRARLRLFVWGAAWLGWFLFGVLSYLHALE
jgi:hypothetical protein